MSQQEQPKRKGPTETFSVTLPDGTVQSVELPAATSMTALHSVTLNPGELATDEAVLGLMLSMFNHPEYTFEHFSEYRMPKDEALTAAIKRGDILLQQSENYYYKHPQAERLYVKLNPAERPLAAWEKQLVDAGPSYARKVLVLSDRKRREYETWEKIEMEEVIRKQRKAAQHAFDVFLSYSDRDHAIAEHVYQTLEGAGAKVYMAPKSIQPGDDFAEELRQALVGSAELWVLVSPNSLNSEWVTTEWGAAWVLQKRIVPVLHRCDTPEIPERLRRHQNIDASAVGEFARRRFNASRSETDS
jgi:hypothetical protein